MPPPDSERGITKIYPGLPPQLNTGERCWPFVVQLDPDMADPRRSYVLCVVAYTEDYQHIVAKCYPSFVQPGVETVSFLVEKLVFEHCGTYRLFVRVYDANAADFFINSPNPSSSGDNGWIGFKPLEDGIEVLDGSADSLDLGNWRLSLLYQTGAKEVVSSRC
jgi:hypothetical protein